MEGQEFSTANVWKKPIVVVVTVIIVVAVGLYGGSTGAAQIDVWTPKSES